ncbi:MAG TPA: phenylalanine--tRNA ligase subunit beta, partial [Acidimicrobiales bacterium]|nr:phenylalanine--tRNA ligase subunit beta [Acidimicrobiales bacterium]
DTLPHPKADRVQLVDGDAGDGPVRVVCGAFNFGAGDLVPLVRPGARLPGGLEIGRRKVRGEWSDGMLCSGAELRLSDDHSGILVLPADAPVGAPLVEALGINPDVVFDLDVTPNRPDALCVAGVARDLAARLRLPFAVPEPPSLDGQSESQVSVVVESSDLCPRFTATRLDGVTIGSSPAWLASRLTLSGMRPINNVVDVSNYVMLELGQPNHPYDLDRLPGGGLLVRRAADGEVLVTLDEVERRLSGDDCLICDAEGAPVGIGGIMGGASSEISEATSTVLLEAAWFSPLAIARTSKRLALRTEASVRFERGVDPAGTGRSVARFCQLAADVASASVNGPMVDVRGDVPSPPRVVVRTSRVNAVLGTALSPDEVAGYLEPIGFSCSPGADGHLAVEIPTWRPDCEREIDVVEEVARHHGYDRISRTLPMTAAVDGGLTPYQRDRRRVRQVLVGAGLSEAWSNSFLPPDALARAGLATDAVRVENPLAQEESVLRALVTNQSHRNPDVALFEIGHVFLPPPDGEELPREPEQLAVVLAGRPATEAMRVWRLLADSLALEPVKVETGAAAGLHPTRTASLHAGALPLGVVGEVDPDVLAAHDLPAPVAWFELDLGALLAAPRRPRVHRPVSRYPSADVDLDFVADDTVTAGDLELTLRSAGAELLEDVWLFDVYRGPQLGEGRRSLTYRLRFSALDHTLDEDELAAVRTRCIKAVESTFPATLRG